MSGPRAWSLAVGQFSGAASRHACLAAAILFSPDGRSLPTAWAADACAQACRSVSRTERSVYRPDQDYRSPCTSG